MLEMEDACWKRQVPGGMCEVVRWKESLDPEWLCRCAVIRIFCKFSRQWDVKSDSLRFSLGLRGETNLKTIRSSDLKFCQKIIRISSHQKSLGH